MEDAVVELVWQTVCEADDKFKLLIHQYLLWLHLSNTQTPNTVQCSTFGQSAATFACRTSERFPAKKLSFKQKSPKQECNVYTTRL